MLHVAWMLTRHLQYLIRQFNFSKITDETKTNDIIFNPAMFVHKKNVIRNKLEARGSKWEQIKIKHNRAFIVFFPNQPCYSDDAHNC